MFCPFYIGMDFDIASNIMTITLLRDEQSVPVPLNITDDNILEGTETIILQLNLPTGSVARLGTTQLTTVIISDDEGIYCSGHIEGIYDKSRAHSCICKWIIDPPVPFNSKLSLSCSWSCGIWENYIHIWRGCWYSGSVCCFPPPRSDCAKSFHWPMRILI